MTSRARTRVENIREFRAVLFEQRARCLSRLAGCHQVWEMTKSGLYPALCYQVLKYDACRLFEVRGNRTGRGWFVKGRSGDPSGRPKDPPEFAPDTDDQNDPGRADRRTIGNLVIAARKFSGLGIDTFWWNLRRTTTRIRRATTPRRRF
jgi:hypothetical protein